MVRHQITVDSFWAVYNSEQITTNCESISLYAVIGKGTSQRVRGFMR